MELRMELNAEMERLCSYCLNDTGRPDTALLQASAVGHEKCVDILLNQTVTVDDISAALVVAASAGNTECVKSLSRSKKVNMNDENIRLALHSAVCEGHSSIIRLLIEAGADVNMADEDGQTVLMQVIKQGYLKAAEMIVRSGADLNITDKWGKTALMMASQQGNENMLDALLQMGADVNTVDSSMATALTFALSFNHRRCAEMLIKAGANMNIKNRMGETPLTFAANKGDISLIRFLLKSGAEINLTIDKGLYTRLNSLMYHVLCGLTVSRNIMRLLYVAGEHFNPERLALDRKRYVEKSDFFTEVEEGRLLQQCRIAIRNQLLHVDSHRNLFCAIANLGLPKQMEDYLLYNETLTEA